MNTAVNVLQAGRLSRGYFAFPVDELDEAIVESGLQLGGTLSAQDMRHAAAKVLIALSTALTEQNQDAYMVAVSLIEPSENEASRKFTAHFFRHLLATAEKSGLTAVINSDADLSARIMSLELYFS